MSYAVLALMCGGGFGAVSVGGGGGDEPKCENGTGVTGHGDCRSYGRWQAKRHPTIYEVSTITSMVDLSGIDATGDIDHEGTSSDYRYRVVSEDLGQDAPTPAFGLAFRMLYPGRTFYAGVEADIAGISGGEGAQQMDAATGAMMTPRVASILTATGVLGARGFGEPFGGALPLSFGAEVTGGVRAIAITVDSRHGTCEAEDTVTHAQPVVEARARADLWLTPRVSLGAYAGADVLTGLPSGGLTVSAHMRAFDGAR